MTNWGAGTVDTDDGPVRVAASGVGTALHGDRVRVALQRQRLGAELRGRVIEILDRPAQRLIGECDSDRGFVPDDARFPRALLCARPKAPSDGTLYGAELLPDVSRAGPQVRLLYRFGERGVAADELEAMLWREDVEDGFPRAALAEARAASEAEHRVSRDYEDLRSLAFVTIDPPDAEDHDDALFIEELGGGRTRCCVAIADVAALIEPGGALDEEAVARGATLYLPGRVIPMLPRCISADAASLLPGADRRAVVLDLTIDSQGRTCSRALRLAIIRSREHLTYDGAADLLWDVDSAPEEIRRYAGMVRQLDAVATLLRSVRQRRGAMLIDTPAVRIEATAAGEPLGMTQVQTDHWRKRACGLVEEFMLLANETVAELLREAGLSSFGRAHEAPRAERMVAVQKTARAHGLKLPSSLLADPRALQRAISDVENVEAREALRAALLDAMPAAGYDVSGRRHFALATSDYVHFTSPIRRYPDVLVHRAVRALVLGERHSGGALNLADLNQKQQRARRVHYETTSLYGALIARNVLGKRMHGTVTRLGKRDAHILADDPAVTVRCDLPDAAIAHGDRVVIIPERIDIATRSVHGRLLARAG